MKNRYALLMISFYFLIIGSQVVAMDKSNELEELRHDQLFGVSYDGTLYQQEGEELNSFRLLAAHEYNKATHEYNGRCYALKSSSNAGDFMQDDSFYQKKEGSNGIFLDKSNKTFVLQGESLLPATWNAQRGMWELESDAITLFKLLGCTVFFAGIVAVVVDQYNKKCAKCAHDYYSIKKAALIAGLFGSLGGYYIYYMR